MRKEVLLSKKQDAIGNAPWYAKLILQDEDLKKFSISQLNALCDIMQRAEKERESRSPFFTLSANEVLRKETGKIAYFYDDGRVCEETEEEVLRGAAGPIYKDYRRREKRG